MMAALEKDTELDQLRLVLARLSVICDTAAETVPVRWLQNLLPDKDQRVLDYGLQPGPLNITFTKGDGKRVSVEFIHFVPGELTLTEHLRPQQPGTPDAFGLSVQAERETQEDWRPIAEVYTVRLSGIAFPKFPGGYPTAWKVL